VVFVASAFDYLDFTTNTTRWRSSDVY